MSVMDRLISAIKIGDNLDEGYDDYDEDYDDPEPERPSRKVSPFRQPSRGEDYDDGGRERDRAPRGRSQYSEPAPASPSNARSSKKPLPSAGMEVCVIKPTSIDDAKEITETLLSNRTVVLNLEGLDFGIAQRILDFTSGSCYAISGNLQNISRYIFVITPSAVDISGDISEALMADTSSFGGSSLDIPLG